MSLLQSFKLDHLPKDVAVHVALYENVRNAAFLQQQLLQGNTDFEYAFIDASAVCCNFDVFYGYEASLIPQRFCHRLISWPQFSEQPTTSSTID